MNRYDRVRCRVAIRPTYDGRAAKPGVAALNGTELTLLAGYKMDDGDRYPGEYAMSPVDIETSDLLMKAGTAYIAEGDIEVIEEVATT